MKTTNFILPIFLCLLAVSFGSQAQDYAFRVLVNKGNNEIKSGAGWQSLKVGAKLKSTDEVKISENAYLGLVHQNGKPLELKKAGKFKVVDLAKNMDGGSSVITKYTDFILSENTQKRNTQVATGAVHRGIKTIETYIPESQNAIVYGSRVTLNWADSIKGPYIVSFTSMFGDGLDSIMTDKNFVTIDLSSDKFKNEDNINVTIEPKLHEVAPSEQRVIKRMSSADRERIKPVISQVTSNLKEETALNKLILASAFEESNLLIDAATAYLDAIRLEPTVDDYQESYDAFLFRNGLKGK